jgi:hypothetical protein
MPVRRFRFLALAVFAAIALFLFTRSTSTYENYKSFAEEKYENVVGGGSVLRPDAEEEQTKDHKKRLARRKRKSYLRQLYRRRRNHRPLPAQ